MTTIHSLHWLGKHEKTTFSILEHDNIASENLVLAVLPIKKKSLLFKLSN